MPHFFQFSKNGRKTVYVRKSKQKRYAEPNGSTMNRICKRFDTIGNINLNYAGVPPFNWQMLVDGPCLSSRPDIVTLFCNLDDANISNLIEGRGYTDLGEKDAVLGYDLLKDIIIEEITALCGSLEYAYPFIVKHLFAGEGLDKASHKQMFWRVFGEIAVRNIANNLQNCHVCPECGMKSPAWAKEHFCIKVGRGFYECVDCGMICERSQSRQYRCEECQKEHRLTQFRTANKKRYQPKKKVS